MEENLKEYIKSVFPELEKLHGREFMNFVYKDFYADAVDTKNDEEYEEFANCFADYDMDWQDLNDKQKEEVVNDLKRQLREYIAG